MQYQLIIKNAHYYSADSFFDADILVNGGKICAITASGSSEGLTAERIIDASGLTVLPGIIDSHVHFRDPNRPDQEDFYTGSCAAVAGGVTTFIEMPSSVPPANSPANLQNRIDSAAAKAICDFAMYGAAGYENTHQFQPLLDMHVVAFKTFLAAAPKGREAEFDGITVCDDGQLYMMLLAGAKTDGRFFFHCENAALISALEKDLIAKGETGNDFHYRSRPAVAEVESVSTILHFAKATGCKVGIVHITTPEACELVKQAKLAGVDVAAETCFHYLTYHHRHIDEFGPYAKCNPPLRSESDMQGLWPYLLDGTITMVGSDHAPFIPEEKSIGLDKGIRYAYAGMPAVELLLPIMLTHVEQGRLSLCQLARFISENTARLHGLFPQKGIIRVGADADFAMIDMNKEYIIRREDMYSKAKEINTLFEGTKVKGKPAYTVVRGRVLMQDGKVDVSAKAYGQFVPSNRC